MNRTLLIALQVLVGIAFLLLPVKFCRPHHGKILLLLCSEFCGLLGSDKSFKALARIRHTLGSREGHRVKVDRLLFVALLLVKLTKMIGDFTML